MDRFVLSHEDKTTHERKYLSILTAPSPFRIPSTLQCNSPTNTIKLRQNIFPHKRNAMNNTFEWDEHNNIRFEFQHSIFFWMSRRCCCCSLIHSPMTQSRITGRKKSTAMSISFSSLASVSFCLFRTNQHFFFVISVIHFVRFCSLALYLSFTSKSICRMING